MAQQVNLAELFDAYKREDAIEVVAAGTYRLEVLRASVRNGNKGPGIMPVYRVHGGPYDGKTVMAGQFTASEAGRSIFFRQMAGFGLGEDFFRQGNDIDAAAKAIVGRIVDAQITVKPWQGQDRNNIAIGGIKLVSTGSDPVAAGFAAAPAQTAPAPPETPAQTAPPAPPAAQQAAPPPAQEPAQEVNGNGTTAAVPPMPPIPTANAPF